MGQIKEIMEEKELVRPATTVNLNNLAINMEHVTIFLP